MFSYNKLFYQLFGRATKTDSRVSIENLYIYICRLSLWETLNILERMFENRGNRHWDSLTHQRKVLQEKSLIKPGTWNLFFKGKRLSLKPAEYIYLNFCP
jgi:hypothetical protein